MKPLLLSVLVLIASALAWQAAFAADPSGPPLPAGPRFEDESWVVQSVSADGRVLVVQGRGGGCGHDPRATVVETASTVEIRVQQRVPRDMRAIDCPSIARIDVLRVRLSAPIAGRALRGQSLRTATAARPAVPRMVGLRAEDAAFTLRAQGFRVRGDLDGVVKGQLSERGIVTLQTQSPATVPPLRPVAFRTIAVDDGASSRLQRTGFVVRGERRWKKVWRSLGEAGRPPAIDFSRHMLLVASQGRQPSGGHRLRITDVGDSGGTLFADVTETSPGSGCVTSGVITSPYHVVRVPRSDKAVRFLRHPKEKACASGVPAARRGDEVDPQILDGTEQRRLDRAREQWRRAGLHDYRFRVALLCFCGPEIRKPAVIRVVRGRPHGVPSHLREAATVPRLLRLVQQAIDHRVSGLSVHYGRHGVPRSIGVDGSEGIADDEQTYVVDRFRAAHRAVHASDGGFPGLRAGLAGLVLAPVGAGTRAMLRRRRTAPTP